MDHRHLHSGPNPKELGEEMEGRDLKKIKKKRKGLGKVMELISKVAWKQKRKINVILRRELEPWTEDLWCERQQGRG